MLSRGGREVLSRGGREVLSRGGGEGGVVQRGGGCCPEGGRCCPKGGRCCPEGGVVHSLPSDLDRQMPVGGGEVLSRGGEGGVVQRGEEVLSTPPLPGLGQTNACENITFARFATRAVIIAFNAIPLQESSN